MILTCPGCGERHVDEGVFAARHHHTHACQHCGLVWRPAIVCTVGVRFLPGFKHEAPVFADDAQGPAGETGIARRIRQEHLDRARVCVAAQGLFDNRVGWGDGRDPTCNRETWADLGAALYGENDPRVQELRGPR